MMLRHVAAPEGRIEALRGTLASDRKGANYADVRHAHELDR